MAARDRDLVGLVAGSSRRAGGPVCPRRGGSNYRVISGAHAVASLSPVFSRPYGYCHRWRRAGGLDVVFRGELVRGSRSIEQDLWRYNRDFIMRLGQVAPGMSDAGMLDEMSAMVRSIALLYPALLALASMAGITLAWVWHRRIAQRPLGPAPAGFSSFEFSDQLVWGWVIGLALCLAPLPEVWSSVRRQPAPGLGGVVCGPRTGGVRGRNPQGSGPGHSHAVTGCHAAVAVCGGRADPAGAGRHLARFPTPPCRVGYLRETPL